MVDAAENRNSESTYSSAVLKSSEKGSGCWGPIVLRAVDMILDLDLGYIFLLKIKGCQKARMTLGL